MSAFLERWQGAVERLVSDDKDTLRLVVVRGGAGGVELLLLVQRRLENLLVKRGLSPDRIEFVLVVASERPLATFNSRTSGKFERILAKLGVETHFDTRVVRVDEHLRSCSHEGVLAAGDIATMVDVLQGKVAVQSVDYFRSFVDDPYVFGRIAANHALGDVWAMGAEPQSALAIATIPYASEDTVEETLYQLLAGAISMLDEAGAVLAGSHSSEGAELTFGLDVTGIGVADDLLRESGMRPGDQLILTKPLGTGTLHVRHIAPVHRPGARQRHAPHLAHPAGAAKTAAPRSVHRPGARPPTTASRSRITRCASHAAC